MREVRPAVYVTYNGDFFDWPFLETRAAKLGMDMAERIGFRMHAKENTCLSRWALRGGDLHPGFPSFHRATLTCTAVCICLHCHQ